ncbi:Cell division protein FtsA [Ralstonia syzygii]
MTQRWGGQIEYADLRYPNGFAVRAAGVRFLTDAQAAVLARGASCPAPAMPPRPTRKRGQRGGQQQIDAKHRENAMSKEYKDLLVGLDIGTSKVVAVVAELRPDGAYEVIGMGQTESKGLKKGVVVNIEATVQSIQKALEEAELMADCKISEVFTGIAGSHIRSFNSSGMVAIKDKEVTPADVARVIETAKAVNIPTDQQILHILTQEFIIDGQEDVREPIGMSGIRLEVKVHIVTGAVSAAQNIVKCVRRCGLEVHDLILQPLASSLAVLTEDEKELGVVLVDIGSGTTDIAIFSEGAIRHTAVIPIAGDQITNDIAMALRTPTPDAEDIKIQYGIAKQVLADPDEMIDVPGVGDRGPRTLSRQALAAVIEPRVEELFSLVHQVVRESGYEELLSSGVVLTGGTAMMPGMVELGEDIFLKPVRVGVPEYRGNLHEVVKSPRYSTVMGLLQEGRVQRMRGRKVAVQSGSAKQIWTRMKEWFIGNF